jgi:para-nitrobenzyl esterase
MADPNRRENPGTAASRLAADPSLLVATTAGPVIGVAEDTYRSWKGIRYASAPVGELRWRAPRPPQPWGEAHDAAEFGSVCPQPANPMIVLPEGVRFDEDCLTLNVWAAAECRPENPGPVMVWVHGGAYIFGASCQPMFDPNSLISTQPLVVVTVNYRVGALGFLDLTSFNTDEATFDSNLALRDVLFALNWVKDNIAGFGGDPTRVTLAGESAGGGLVTTLLTVPAAAGLFSRAIAQSAPATSVYDRQRSAKVAGMFVEALGVAEDVSKLRELPSERIVAEGFALYSAVPREFPGTLAYAPVVEEDLLPDYPLSRFRDGQSHPVPLVLGTNKDEAAVFKFMKSPLMPITSEAIMAMFAGIADDHPDLDLPTDAQVGSAYAGVSLKAKGLGVARDLGFRMPAIWLAEGHCQVAPVYLYRFDWATAMLRLLGLGATHATELPYLWGHLVSGPKDITFRLGGQAAAQRISQRMQARWVAFIAGDAPDAGAKDPAWPQYLRGDDSGGDQVRATLVIDAHDRVEFDLDRNLRLAWGDEVLSFR